MNSKRHSHKGFTLLETILSTIIFVLVLVGSFVLYGYIIKAGVTNKHVSDIKNLEISTVQLLEGMVRVDGWETFLDNYLGKGDNTSSVHAGIFSAPSTLNANSNPGTLGSPNEKTFYQWKFQINVDDSAGPYLKTIEKDATAEKYTLTFSQKVTIPNYPPSRLFPVINNPSHMWDYYEITSSISAPTSTVIIEKKVICTTYTTPADCDAIPLCKYDTNNTNNTNNIICNERYQPVTSGDRIKPSKDIVYKSSGAPDLSDITYTKGVSLPSTAELLSKGYPQIIKALLTLILTEGETKVTYEVEKNLQYIE